MRGEKSKKRVGIVLSSFLICLLFFTPTYAQDETPPQPETSEITSPPSAEESADVPSPGLPWVVSSTDVKGIVWEWVAPSVEPDTEQTAILSGYGFELVKDEEVVQSGAVATDVLSVTTTVSEDGNYTFRVWALAEGGLRSAKVESQTTIVTPVYTPINEAELVPSEPVVPQQPLVKKPSETTQEPGDAESSDTFIPRDPDFTQNAQVLSAENKPADVIATVVKPSTQGWLLFGLPWYVWLLATVTVVGVFRWFVVRSRRTY